MTFRCQTNPRSVTPRGTNVPRGSTFVSVGGAQREWWATQMTAYETSAPEGAIRGVRRFLPANAGELLLSAVGLAA